MMEASVSGGFTSGETERNSEPYVGMTFDSEAAARTFYTEYAARSGFSIRVTSSRKSECDGSIISRGLGCRNIHNVQKSGSILNEGGEKRRDGCTAALLVKRENEGRWIVQKFVRDHNHPLVVSSPTRPTFDEKDKRIQELTAELRIKKRLSAAYKEQLLFLMKDVESHNGHITSKVQTVRYNLNELEARRHELSTQNKPSL